MLHVLSFKFWQDMSSSLTNRWPLSRTVWQSFLLLMPPELSVSVPGLWGHPGTLPAPVFCRWAEEWCSSVPWHQERLYLADDPRCWSWRHRWMEGWVGEWMDGWMDEWIMDRKMDEWVSEWWVGGWLDERDGWMDEQVDRWVNGWMDGLVHWWIMNKWLAGWLVGWMDRCGWGDGWVGRWMDSTSNSEVPTLCQAQCQALEVLRWLAPALNFKGTHSPTGQDVTLLNQHLIRAITEGKSNGLSTESGCTDWVPKDTQVSLGHCIQHRISHTSQAFLWPKWNFQRVK